MVRLRPGRGHCVMTQHRTLHGSKRSAPGLEPANAKLKRCSHRKFCFAFGLQLPLRGAKAVFRRQRFPGLALRPTSPLRGSGKPFRRQAARYWCASWTGAAGSRSSSSQPELLTSSGRGDHGRAECCRSESAPRPRCRRSSSSPAQVHGAPLELQGRGCAGWCHLSHEV